MLRAFTKACPLSARHRPWWAGGAGSHLGRPKENKPRVFPHAGAACLVELLDRDVVLADEPAGDGAKKVVADLRTAVWHAGKSAFRGR